MTTEKLKLAREAINVAVNDLSMTHQRIIDGQLLFTVIPTEIQRIHDNLVASWRISIAADTAPAAPIQTDKDRIDCLRVSNAELRERAESAEYQLAQLAARPDVTAADAWDAFRSMPNIPDALYAQVKYFLLSQDKPAAPAGINTSACAYCGQIEGHDGDYPHPRDFFDKLPNELRVAAPSQAADALGIKTWRERMTGELIVSDGKKAISARDAEIADLRAALSAQQKDGAVPVACGACHGSWWVSRDPDIGTEQECFCCEGSGECTNTDPQPESQCTHELRQAGKPYPRDACAACGPVGPCKKCGAA